MHPDCTRYRVPMFKHWPMCQQVILPMEARTRPLQFDCARADDNQRTVPLVLSSETPVQRWEYDEVLDHSPDAVDLGCGSLPLLIGHETGPVPVASVDNLRLGPDRKLRGTARFGTSARAQEVFEDVKAGVIRAASVAYRILDYVIDAGTLRATRWAPYEVSAVGVGADPEAGFYRSNQNSEGNNYMSIQNEGQPAADAGTITRSQRRAQNTNAAKRAVEAERERVAEIHAIGNDYGERYPGVREVADNAIETGLTVDEFRQRALNAMKTVPCQLAGFSNGADYSSRQYSLTRAVSAMIDPSSCDAGFEREVSQEIAHRSGRKPRGMYMPMGELHQRTVSVSNSGSLVGTDHLADSFIDALRARSVVMNLGPTILPDLTGDASIPRLASSATSYWIAGDGSDKATQSTPSFDAVTLTPKTVGALVLLSRKAVLQAEPDAEDVTRNDLAQVIAGAIDKAAIQGSGTSNEPTGVINTSGVSTDSFAAAAPAFSEIVAMESDLLAANADATRAAYLTNPSLAGALKTTDVGTDTGTMIWTPGQEPGVGRVNGYRAFASGHVPSKKVILGNWADLCIGMWGGVDIEVDPYHDFAKGTVAVRCFASVDFGVRHAQSFAVYTTL